MNGNLIFLLASITLGASGQILLKSAVNRMGQIDLTWPNTFNTILHIFSNPWTISGIFCFVASMVLWVKVISGMELSKAYPSLSLSYVIVFLFSVFLFKESISSWKIIGVSLVSLGVYFLNI